MTAPPPLHLRHLTLRHGPTEAVRDLSGTFQPGSLTAIAGANGAGKTTLLRAMAGIHPIASGEIDRDGLRQDQIALLPQGSQLDRSFPLTCQDVVALGLTARLGAFRGISRAQRAAAADALAAVGLPGHAARPIGALSTGQFQRVLFARMMLQDAPVLLMDEPFAGVDAVTAEDLMALVTGWSHQGRTILIVLHDVELIRHSFPSVLLLNTDPVAWGATRLVLTDANRRRAGLMQSRLAA